MLLIVHNPVDVVEGAKKVVHYFFQRLFRSLDRLGLSRPQPDQIPVQLALQSLLNRKGILRADRFGIAYRINREPIEIS